MGWNFGYDNFNEKTGRVTYAQNLYDATLDRGYDYDQVGRLFPAKFSKTAMPCPDCVKLKPRSA